MIIDPVLAQTSDLRTAIHDAYRADEAGVVRRLLSEVELPHDAHDRIAERARALVGEVRRSRIGQGGIDAFMHEFELSSKEGVVLMCLAEALLRVPDAHTLDKLIKDKIATADWHAHLGHSDSIFVNASTWALMLTGRVVKLEDEETKDFGGVLRRLVHRSGEPVIRTAITRAMRILGQQFVMGRSIKEAVTRAKPDEARGYRYSYDMLGEGARTMPDADRYFESYKNAIAAIGAVAAGKGVQDAPGISVKLSALHPRYEFAQRDRVMSEVVPRLKALAADAARFGIGLTVDAEEADRLDLSLDVIEALAGDPDLAGWDGFGLAVQAYQKRAPFVLDWLASVAARHGRRFMVRLVKGAYWDTEVKLAQTEGLKGYPVYTRKLSTDVSYLACVKRLFADPAAFYPQFATHNAHTVAAIIELAGGSEDYEFQRLHGMGEALYAQIVGPSKMNRPVRIYAPVGSHEDLLAYLVRRLLENGANSSFVNRIQDEKLPIDEIIADPLMAARRLDILPHPKIPLPVGLYGRERANSAGLDLTAPQDLAPLGQAMARMADRGWSGGPLVAGRETGGEARPVHNPADLRSKVGELRWSTPEDIETALARASRAAPAWNSTPAAERADCLRRLADLLESNQANLMALCVREAGKTIADAIAEIREAVDFCRYYAARACEDFGAPKRLPGPTGETNEISLHGRGVFLCISPWNFPLAIFVGQISAALAAGNAVIAKPAEQTGIIATEAVKLMHRAGVPGDIVHLLPGDGATVGAQLVRDQRISGVAFTGSTETARLINQTLATRDGAIVPLIAETGGQNGMIVDSTALPEQVVNDVVASSFQSAGQRCSALRVLFLQRDIADKVITMLSGAMDELVVGDPARLATDVGPVIDGEAKTNLEAHIARMTKGARLLHRTPLSAETAHGTFVAPAAFEIDSIDQLKREVFGPVLHVVRFQAERLDDVIDSINAAGYGLTFGIHSRIDSTVDHVLKRLRVGNAYVNRNTIGAVVGVQPFGGEGLSGTGPKAGGPHYLHRYATERTVTTDTTAAGGNASLMSI
ncbi:bifunctional proline dehydrogenase/L-glutamate gamma-semialdehyde dehydrogenase PutA [Pelagibius sp. Alg239-R121]|uniref:bifunctional proline dehydrogenase/L-glutamate gamma-semialdehyde dehydrogenase PutA n=1 Tax=Pelagibius sp. Alg239-R121 TaxID=2993448 RepID=UPI0024A75506|nr:bifunctional proline dehydrogenase/L-glutamate gamma-semialdehyde dehydrogenase PutA [Pelagibius sp. Alg239-R121]